LVRGGYPEVVSRSSEKRRQAWFDAYLTSILERDISRHREHTGFSGNAPPLEDTRFTFGIPPELLRHIAIIGHPPLNVETIHGDSAVDIHSVRIARMVREYRPRGSSKSPKLMLLIPDCPLIFIGCTFSRLASDPTIAGNLLENFVVSEIIKTGGMERRSVNLFHYRDASDKEVESCHGKQAGKNCGD